MDYAAPSVERNDVDRVAEAWRWLTAELQGGQIPRVLALVGLDEHLLDAIDRYAPGTRVLALEPDQANARTFLAGPTCHAWRGGHRLTYLVGPDYVGADEAWRIFSGTTDSPPVLLYPRLKPTPEVARAALVLRKILVGVAANREARRKFAPRYLVNSIRNLPAIVAGSDLRHLTDAYRGVPAVVAAAGPSLDAALPQLRDVHDRALLVACDTALRPMLVNGIAPQLVVGVDPGELNARHLLSLPACADTWLVSESALDRAATAPFDGRTFWFRVSNHEPWPWLAELGLDIGQVDVWGSVLTAAFQVAVLAGCDPIVIVGADLSFTGGRPYARGTTYEFDWATGTASGTAIEDVWRRQMSSNKLIDVPDLHGRDTVATPALVSFRDWLVARARRSGRRVINASGSGIFFGDGVESGSVADALSQSVVVPPVASFARRHAGVRPSRLAARAREAHAVAAGGSNAPLLVRWAEFSGEGFDRQALGAALNDAASGLETKRGVSATPSLIPWERLAALPVSARVLTHLPESLARFRAVMCGDLPLPVLANASELTHDDRRMLLVEALRLLGLIRDELRRIDDLPSAEPWHVGRLPASVVYAWPEPLRWAVEMFEALLGQAWGSSAVGRDAFFTAPVVPRDSGDVSDAQTTARRRPNSTHACLLLAREWLECHASLETGDEVRESLMRLAGLESAARVSGDGAAADATLVLSARGTESMISIELPLHVGESALGRVLSGVLHPASEAGDVAVALWPHVETTGVTASVVSRAGAGTSRAPHGIQSAKVRRPRLIAKPDERWSIAYPVSQGVVCVRVNDTASVVVRADGSMEPYHRWPRPILSELPLPDGGAIAWGSGRAMDPTTAPYVMYRRAADAEPIVEDLPFNPSWGAWWGNRLYWGYLPSDMQAGRGLGSWAPGEGGRIEHADDFALFDLRSDGTDLLLEPSTRRADFTYERRRLSEGWRWNPARGLDSRPLGPHGAAGSHVVHHGWTTTTFPEADLVTFEHADGMRLSMTVYHPFRAAWLERSLLVSTVDYQLLRFDDVLDDLGA